MNIIEKIIDMQYEVYHKGNMINKYLRDIIKNKNKDEYFVFSIENPEDIDFEDIISIIERQVYNISSGIYKVSYYTSFGMIKDEISKDEKYAVMISVYSKTILIGKVLYKDKYNYRFKLKNIYELL